MMNPDEDTEWNDILRQKGILPPKKVEPIDEPPSPPDPKSLLDDLSLKALNRKLDEAEDGGGVSDEEEAIFLQEYRQKRLAAMQAEAAKACYGFVREVTKSDWKIEVTDVPDAYVVIHVAQRGDLLCNIVDSHLVALARKYPSVKFLRGEACLCIPDYPESNLPTILVYRSGDLKHQFIGPDAVGGKSVTAKGLEWRLSQAGIVESKLEKDPGRRTQVTMVSGRHINRIGGGGHCDSGQDSDNDD